MLATILFSIYSFSIQRGTIAVKRVLPSRQSVQIGKGPISFNVVSLNVVRFGNPPSIVFR